MIKFKKMNLINFKANHLIYKKIKNHNKILMIIFFKIISFNKKNLVLMIFNLKILKKMTNKMINGKFLKQ